MGIFDLFRRHSLEKVTTRRDGSTVTIALHEKFDNETTPYLQNICATVTADKTIDSIVLDLADVRHVDTSAFACIIDFMKKHKRNGVSISAKNIHDIEKSYLETLKLGGVIKIIEEEYHDGKNT